MKHCISCSVNASKTRISGAIGLEFALVLCLLSIIAAIFIPTFFRYVSSSKTSEAVHMLSDLRRRTHAYYQRTFTTTEIVTLCLPSPAGPTPETPSRSPRLVDFASPLYGHTWKSLGLGTISVRYRYQLKVSQPGCNPLSPQEDAVRYVAEGDLDGDKEWSSYTLTDRIDTKRQLLPVGILSTEHPLE